MAGAVGAVDAAAPDPLSTLRVAVFGVAATPVIVDLAVSGLLTRYASPDYTKILRKHLQSLLTPSDDFQATSLQRVAYAGVCIEKVIDELLG
jgi:CO/xanthine dehydrogenase FAD-binding subunit